MTTGVERFQPIGLDKHSIHNDDEEAKKLMKEWGYGGLDEDDTSTTADDTEQKDDDCSLTLGYDEEMEKYRRNVHLGDDELDHIVLGTSDLDRAIDDFEQVIGIRPIMVVSLNGVGTKSARVAFENSTFLEIIGPDPKQENMPLGDQLRALPPGKLIPLHYAVRSSKAEQLYKDNKFEEQWSLETDKVTMAAIEKGKPWRWDLYFLENGKDERGILPYFVDWGDATPVSAKLPVLGTLERVKVRSSASSPIHELLEDIDGILVETGNDDLLEFAFSSETGLHTFSTSEPIGIAFPKEGGLSVKSVF